MWLITCYLACLATFASAASADYDLGERDTCANGYTLCSPAGATTTVTPQIGDSEFPNLFVDIVHSSLPASKRSLNARDTASLCCVESLDCLTMNTLSLPFCYDKFTTNYFLPDGSFGTVVGGSYQSASHDTANLETGDYTLSNGTTGNLYSANEAAKPNTATLPIPSQFTASGVGSAIPASALGDDITLTFTTTLPETTIPATTIDASTTVSSETVSSASVVTTVLTTVANGPSGAVAQSAASQPPASTIETTIISTAPPSPISTAETTIIITPTTIDATTRQASVSVVTTTINTASNPAIFGTNVMTATGNPPVASSTKKKSAGMSQRMPSADVRVLMAICGLAGLILL